MDKSWFFWSYSVDYHQHRNKKVLGHLPAFFWLLRGILILAMSPRHALVWFQTRGLKPNKWVVWINTIAIPELMFDQLVSKLTPWPPNLSMSPHHMYIHVTGGHMTKIPNINSIGGGMCLFCLHILKMWYMKSNGTCFRDFSWGKSTFFTILKFCDGGTKYRNHADLPC